MAGFQQVGISRDLVFKGHANHDQNIKGNPMYEKVFYTNHFIDDTDKTDFVEEATNGSTFTLGTGNGGDVVITLGGTDNDVGEFSHVAKWTCEKNCVMEARIQVDEITLVGLNVGWVDADMSTDDQMCFEITASAATLVDARVTDGAAFVFDTDGSVDVWYMCAVDSDTEGTPVAVAGSTAPVAATYENLRVELNTSGDATFYRNGVAVGFQAAAVSIGVKYTPYVAVIAREGSAKVCTIDRITMWQDE